MSMVWIGIGVNGARRDDPLRCVGLVIEIAGIAPGWDAEPMTPSGVTIVPGRLCGLGAIRDLLSTCGLA